MNAKHCKREELILALEGVNETYDNNITFKSLKACNKKEDRFNFTLRVISSKGTGSKSTSSGRRTISACFHVHWEFFQHLFKINPNVILVSRGKVIPHNATMSELDFKEGNVFNSTYSSQLCQCYSEGRLW